MEAVVNSTRLISLAHSPTPLYRLDKLSNRWGGDIWIKRDDLTGSGMTGNKVRKLEHLISDAEKLGADTLITCGGVQSNHCRATSLAAARLNYKCILLLRGERPEKLDGNLLLDRLAGADVRFVSKQEYTDRLPELLQGLADEVSSRGGKPYLIAEGGSDPVGAQGYVNALIELKNQCDSLGIHPKRIVTATGSGGTHAGLFVGAELSNWDVEIVSAAICYSQNETVERIAAIVERMNRRYGYSISTTKLHNSVLDGYIGPGYAKAHEPVFETIVETASAEGVLVDPVYTGKTAWCIKSEVQAGRFDGVTIFWHTGGVFGIFPFKECLQKTMSWE